LLYSYVSAMPVVMASDSGWTSSRYGHQAFYSRSNSAAVLVTSTDREFNTRGLAGSSFSHLLSGRDLHDTGRRAPRGLAAVRLPGRPRSPRDGREPLSPRAPPGYTGRVGIRRSPRRRSPGILLPPAPLAFPPDGPPASAPTRSDPGDHRRVVNPSWS